MNIVVSVHRLTIHSSVSIPRNIPCFLVVTVDVLSRLGGVLLVLALPHKHCVAPFHLLEMEMV
jgi:hypothetical protein